MSTLRRVTLAARKRRASSQAFREAVRDAAREHSQRAIAEAAGISQQAVQRMLKRLERTP